MLAPQRLNLHGPIDGVSTVGLSRLSSPDAPATLLAAAPSYERHEQPYVVLAAMLAPVMATLALRAAWRPRRGNQWQTASRVVRRVTETETQTETEAEAEAETQTKTEAETKKETKTEPKKKKKKKG